MRCCAEDKEALLLEIYYVLNKQWRFTLTDISFYRLKTFKSQTSPISLKFFIMLTSL